MFDSKPSISPLTRFGIFFLIGGLLLVAVLWGVLKYLPTPKASKGPTDQREVVSNPPSAPGKDKDAPAPSAAPETPAKMTAPVNPKAEAAAQIVRTIEQTLAVLRDPNNPDKKQALDVLKEALRQAEPPVAIAAIRQFLTSGQDAATGEKFKVGESGVLEEAPTMRTLLMDQLGSLSGETKSTDAAEVAREVLSAKNSPDEWAVAMRNLAWADPQGSKAELAGRARELITYTPWQQSPTGGYLEAFDAAAYSGDASLLEVLAPLASTRSPAQQAALVAMDRLSALAPAQVADYLNTHPNVLSDRPLVRADYMGKVNLADPVQKTQAETYLQRTDISYDEKSKFLARLGMPASFVSNNLLTPAQTSTIPLLERREVVNRTAGSWLNSGQYPALQSALQSLINQTKPSGGS
jgi:hypothetical protein